MYFFIYFITTQANNCKQTAHNTVSANFLIYIVARPKEPRNRNSPLKAPELPNFVDFFVLRGVASLFISAIACFGKVFRKPERHLELTISVHSCELRIG